MVTGSGGSGAFFLGRPLTAVRGVPGPTIGGPLGTGGAVVGTGRLDVDATPAMLIVDELQPTVKSRDRNELARGTKY